MAVYRLDDGIWFPDPHYGEPDGLIAVGGDLSTPRLLLAYSHGFFPWFSYKWNNEPHWYCPMQRYVIIPDEIHISHSMKQLMRRQQYEVTINKDFDGVIKGCSMVDGRNNHVGAWLGPNMIEAYTRLHRLGYAASVEVWETITDASGKSTSKLVGGLYGVTLKKAFFGESMFSLVPNASKIALIALAKKLSSNGWHFIDCQFETDHFRSMGGKHISYEEYMEMLETK